MERFQQIEFLTGEKAYRVTGAPTIAEDSAALVEVFIGEYLRVTPAKPAPLFADWRSATNFATTGGHWRKIREGRRAEQVRALAKLEVVKRKGITAKKARLKAGTKPKRKAKGKTYE